MATEDHMMVDITYPELSMTERSQMEAMKAMPETIRQDITRAVDRGMEEIKIDVLSQMEKIHLSVCGRNKRRGRGFIGQIFTWTESSNPCEEEMDVYKRKKNEQYRLLENEKDRLRKAEMEHLRTIQELQLKLNIAEEDARKYHETKLQLDTMDLKNRKLQEQTHMFRDIIISKGSSDHDAVDDSTIVADFVALRAQIQRIVFKFYDVESTPSPVTDRLLSKSLKKRQRKFLSMWDKQLSVPQLRNRTRAVIFELLSGALLQVPIFGLDDFGENGSVEQGLVDLEVAMASTLEHGRATDISSWRIQTMKLASQLPQIPFPSRPSDVAATIWDFMLPLFHNKSEKPVDELRTHLGKLCASAYKLALTLRKCKDTYQCEISDIGDRVDTETMEPQESEAAKGAEENDLRVAFVISGALVKLVELDGQRLVLEKAHVVVTD